jgi:hypothetical protein
MEVKKMKKIYFVFLIGLVSAGLCLVFAANGTMAAMVTGPAGSGIMIEEGTKDTVPYESGGVGIEERAVMKQNINNYNLRLILATDKGLYLAYIPVEIRTPGGKTVFKMKSNGPWLFVKLPEGEYEVMASYKNQEKTWKTQIGMSPQTVELTWKQ